ncbi:MAG: pilus assembly protein TadG-related protein [Pseudomonadota bacterium]|nr:pilus assembly protein TadG-related protein [Pseudomonadota bacterium]
MDGTSIINKLTHFLRDAAGTIGIVFSLSTIPVLLVMGSATDLVSANNMRTRMQAAVDAAALAAATTGGLTAVQRQDLAVSAFHQNFAGGLANGVVATPAFTITDTAVTGSASAQLGTLFMRIAHINALDISAEVKVSIPQSKDVEIALVLDYSGSMKEIADGEVKYQAMATAATGLVTDLASSGKARFGLAPFSHHVYLSMPNKYVMGQGQLGTYLGCTQDRLDPYNLTDGLPDTADESTKWGQPQAPEHSADGCAPYAGKKLQVLPMTDDLNAVTTQLAAMKPNAWTHISLGMEFGWQLVSPDGLWGADVASYDDTGTEKWIILLTDGRQTEPAHGLDGVRNVARGERNLELLCEAVKAKNISVVTIAYDLQDEPTETRLEECASLDKNGNPRFYRAGDGASISEVFTEIKNELAEAIFISR